MLKSRTYLYLNCASAVRYHDHLNETRYLSSMTPQTCQFLKDPLPRVRFLQSTMSVHWRLLDLERGLAFLGWEHCQMMCGNMHPSFHLQPQANDPVYWHVVPKNVCGERAKNA